MAILKRNSSRYALLYTEVIALVVLLSIVNNSLAQFSIPKRYDGFVFTTKPQQSEQGLIQWEVFIDPMCPYSKMSWPIVKEVKQQYNLSSFVLIVHLFPVPFHQNSFFGSRALHIAQMTNASLIYPLLESIFENQDSFSNMNTNKETPAFVKSSLASLASNLGMVGDEFEAGINNAETNRATRSSFKYGCARGVVQTPSFLVNGVAVVGADASWTASNWTDIFDPII